MKSTALGRYVCVCVMTDAVSAIDSCKNGSNAEVDERMSSPLY